jgi:hypothetical protein
MPEAHEQHHQEGALDQSAQAVTCYAFAVRRLLIPLLLVLGLAAPAFAQRPADPPPPPENRVLGGRSSFWGSNRPSEGGAYRWRLLGIGLGLIGITGFVMFRLVKKANRERERRGSASHAESRE